MNNEKSILIVVATDNHYVILLAALIKSIELNHHSGEKLEFYVIDDGISAKNKSKLERSINPSISKITWLRVEDVVPANLTLPTDGSWFPTTALLRIFIPDFIPPSATRVLYLDVDMIVLEDISKLWNTNIGDSIIGAVQDISKTVCSSWGGIPNYEELGIPKEWKYFNSGLLLIDPQKWRENRISHQVIQALQNNLEHASLPDQYGLNVALFDKWYELDPLWNNFSAFDVPNPYIIHYLDIKPIFKSYRLTPRYQKIFFDYLSLTEWRDAKPEGGYKWTLRKIINKTRKNGYQWIFKKIFKTTQERFSALKNR